MVSFPCGDEASFVVSDKEVESVEVLVVSSRESTWRRVDLCSERLIK